MSQPVDHDMTAVLEAIDHYSDGDVDQPQEIMVELQEGCSNKHKRLNKKVYEKEKINKFRSTISLGCFNQAALFHAKNNYFSVHSLN